MPRPTIAKPLDTPIVEDITPPSHLPVNHEWQLLTKPLAERWLKRLEKNRTLSQSTVDRYSEMIERGDWIDYHPIPYVFDVKRNFINGQHRAAAIAQTNTSFYVSVQTYNKSVLGLAESLDRGKGRSTKDILQIALGEKLDKSSASIVRYILLGDSYKKQIHDRQLVEFYAIHTDRIKRILAISKGVNKFLRRSVALAAVIRASFHLTDHVIEEFFDLLRTPQAREPYQLTILPYRDRIMQIQRLSAQDAQEIYLRTEWVLEKLAFKEHVSRSQAATKELFPLQ